ncbi:MAG TPA: CinA family nicotinamide mononucleotide deamidase-related protein [Pirellulaceae bacterium]|jgi:nicotinamide-nucleotide amidase|nr:CinA family nicotinamide mononucleotide deamidase-related protein [Pirellulaceae bacterium]
MRVEVISVGDEIVTGQRLDTNTQWLSQRLSELGLRPAFHSTVGDDLEDNARVFREAAERADLIVCSGGLGPTDDDLVRQALAAAAGVELVLDEASLAHIEGLFAKRYRTMPPKNRVQAMFPQGAEALFNAHGSAPGIWMEMRRKGEGEGGRTAAFACLPGVPAEMKEMWASGVLPRIGRIAGDGRTYLAMRRVKCFGVGESDLEAKIPDLIKRGRDPLVGITVHEATITLRIVAEGKSEAEVATKIDDTVRQIDRQLGTLVFGQDDDELQDVVIARLKARGETLAIVEWGTGGLATEWLCEVDPTQATFRGSQLFRRRRPLTRVFPAAFGGGAAADGDDELRLEEAIDLPRDARRAAEACREAYDADWTLLMGPILNDRAPASGYYDSDDDLLQAQALEDLSSAREGLAVLCGKKGTELKSFPAGGHPAIVQPRFAKTCLNWLRLRLIEEDAMAELKLDLE